MYSKLLVLISAVSLVRCEGESVEIEQGKLLGKSGLDRKGNVFYSFLSVPYAKSPLGELRFKPPQEPAKWEGVLNATVDMPPCSQLSFGTAIGQEDCLFLNVHTPKLPKSETDKLLPVFFFIHGGAFIEGSGNTTFFGGEFLVPAQVVVVTINYRLGLFGFLSSKDETLNIPGNAGLKDQNMALRWVKKNIAKFGGDPNNVMIVGESAGGASVHYHMLSPASRGLFHKVIAMSGTALNPWAVGVYGTLEILGKEHFGVDSGDSNKMFKALNALPTEKVLHFQKLDGLIISVHEEFQSSPIIEKPHEGAFITESPLQIIKSGNYAKVPFMLGYTNKDGLAIEVIHRLYTGEPMLVEDFSLMVPRDMDREGKHLKELEQKIKRFYFGDENPTVNNLDKSTDMFTGVWFLTGISKVIKFQTEMEKNVYLYRISADTKLNYFKKMTPDTSKVKGTSHIDDLGYLFKTATTPEFTKGSNEDLAIDNMVTLFTDFLKFGKPREDWLPVTPENMNFMEIGISAKPGNHPDKEQFEFWNNLYKTYSKL